MQKMTKVRKDDLGSRFLRQKRISKILIITFFIVYTLITLFPFYALFIRTFVGTKHATDLWLWPPPMEEASLDYQWGNLSVFYNLDLDKVKAGPGYSRRCLYSDPLDAAKGLPKSTTYLNKGSRITLPRIPFTVAGSFFLAIKSSGGALFRTILITALSLIGMNLLSILTGFGLAGLKRKDQVIVFNIYLLSAIIPMHDALASSIYDRPVAAKFDSRV